MLFADDVVLMASTVHESVKWAGNVVQCQQYFIVYWTVVVSQKAASRANSHLRSRALGDRKWPKQYDVRI